VLITEGHEGRTYELAGDESWTLSELASEISRQIGTEIPYKNLPEEEYSAALIGFGLPEAFARVIASWDVGASEGALFDDSRQLSKLTRRPTTPLSIAVADALKQIPPAEA
jgi:NAD(P)H dehydrogenase (quinone)